MAQIPDLDAIMSRHKLDIKVPVNELAFVRGQVKAMIVEGMRQVLKLAAEKATTRTVGRSDGYECWDVEEVDKQSITGVIDLVKY